MPTTALIAAGVGAAGSIGGALISSNAASNASAASLAQQQRMFGVAQDSLNPFIKSGQSVLPTLQSLLTPGASQTATLSQTPGFQFNSQYGTMAATNALSARSGPSAGPLATAISQYNQGLAGNTWQNTVNALQGYANTGANAAGNLAGGAITSGANMGNTAASGILGSGNALAGGVTGAASAGSNALLYSQLFGGGGNGGGGLYSGFSGPAYGGGNALTDAYGGNPNNPLPGLTPADYGN